MPVYLDNAASTRIDTEVLAAMQPWLTDEFANPSSRHRPGVRAREAIERARDQVARATGARSEGVIFTSGGTEANNLGVLGQARARARHGRHVLCGATEHPCVRVACDALRAEGFEVEDSRLTPDGALDLDHLAAKLRGDTVLVAQMLVQNEFGTVYPVQEVARLVRARAPRAAVHVDAVQGAGKLEISLATLGVTSLAVTAHKVHGPKGAGALVISPETPILPSTFGGGQERNLRSGTENVAGIVGLGLSVELGESLRARTHERALALRKRFVDGLSRIPGARLLEPGASRIPPVPSIVALCIPALPAEVRMHHLESQDVIVSAGSACQSKKKEMSAALVALGLSNEEARSVLRVSFSRFTTEADIDRALAALEQSCTSLASPRR